MRPPAGIRTALLARLAAASSSLVLVGWLGSARGADGPSCDLVVQGTSVEPWRGALMDLRRLASARAMDLGCRKLSVRVHPRGATLLFRVRDGRVAVRTLAQPRELWPTVVALSVTVPAPVAADLPMAVISPSGAGPWPPAPLPPSASPAASEPGGDARDEAAAASGDEPGVRLADALRVGLSAGARAGAGGLSSPRVDAQATLASSRAELGVLAAWEPGYVRLGDDSVEGASNGISVGALAGRRQPLLGQTAVVGGRAEVAVLGGAGSESRAEARLGAYAGLVIQDLLPIPLRATVAFDVLPAEIGGPGPGSASPSPWWAMSFGVGVELGGA